MRLARPTAALLAVTLGSSALFATTIVRRARADVSEADRTLAEALFRDAKKLMQAGQIGEACAKFAESQRVAPAIGTLLNLAACHEKLGRIASAWGEYSAVASQAAKTGDDDRGNFARQRVAALEPKLPRLTIIADEVPPGLTLELDGTALSPAALGSAIPLDPGEHEISASAPNRKKWKVAVTFAQAPDAKTGETKTLHIPALPADTPPPQKASSDSDLSTLGWVSLGIGGVGLLGGTIFGVRALALKGGADCQGKVCSQKGLDDIDKARTSATISTISFGVGLVGVAVGTYLLVSSSSSSSPKTTGWSFTPAVGTRGGGVSLSTDW